jgi:hypothetical protein
MGADSYVLAKDLFCKACGFHLGALKGAYNKTWGNAPEWARSGLSAVSASPAD